jgi:glutamine synthetase
LAKIREITLFLNPIANSYERFGVFEAPKYVSWSHRNRSQLIRIPAATGEKVRMELRSPDPSINPYLSFALILEAGLDGIENELKLPPEVDGNLYLAPESITNNLEQLPIDLTEAIELAQNSEFVRSVVGDELLASYIKIKKAETKLTAEDYFEFI